MRSGHDRFTYQESRRINLNIKDLSWLNSKLNPLAAGLKPIVPEDSRTVLSWSPSQLQQIKHLQVKLCSLKSQIGFISKPKMIFPFSSSDQHAHMHEFTLPSNSIKQKVTTKRIKPHITPNPKLRQANPNQYGSGFKSRVYACEFELLVSWIEIERKRKLIKKGESTERSIPVKHLEEFLAGGDEKWKLQCFDGLSRNSVGWADSILQEQIWWAGSDLIGPKNGP